MLTKKLVYVPTFYTLAYHVQSFYRALIEREDQEEAIRIDLRDKGAGSDQIANDGIYSRYFSRYDGFNGRYTL